MKISVITINFNNAEGLKKTLNSVASQSYRQIEHIVIDGGSADDSKAIINSEKSIAFSVSEPDRGIYDAMNKGIKAASGDYLLFINSGDSLTNHTVIADAVAAGLDTDLVSGNMYYIDNGSKSTWIPPGTLTFGLFLADTIPHPATFIKRDVFERVGLFDDNLKIASDWKFFLLAACRYNCSYKHIDLFIADFVRDGLSNDPQVFETIRKEREQTLQTYFPRFIDEYQELLDARKQLRKLRYTIAIKRFLRIR